MVKGKFYSMKDRDWVALIRVAVIMMIIIIVIIILYISNIKLYNFCKLMEYKI